MIVHHIYIIELFGLHFLCVERKCKYSLLAVSFYGLDFDSIVWLRHCKRAFNTIPSTEFYFQHTQSLRQTMLLLLCALQQFVETGWFSDSISVFLHRNQIFASVCIRAHENCIKVIPPWCSDISWFCGVQEFSCKMKVNKVHRFQKKCSSHFFHVIQSWWWFCFFRIWFCGSVLSRIWCFTFCAEQKTSKL